MLTGTKIVLIYKTAKIMEKNLKKLRVIRFIPTILVQTKNIGRFVATSNCLYEDLFSAKEAMEGLIKTYESFCGWSVVRTSIIRKVIEI